jgi:hypothetical protein
MKTCAKCLSIKKYSDFNKKSSSSDGYSSWCKVCNKENSLNHYTKTKRVHDVKELDNKVHCRGCKQYLEKSMFYETTKTYCKECYKNRENVKNLKKFNITQKEYDDMLNAQNGVCKICKKDDNGKRLCIDHDHSCCSGRYSCGKCIRGLLCNKCNRFIGEVDENTKLLKSMIDYITTYQRGT